MSRPRPRVGASAAALGWFLGLYALPLLHNLEHRDDHTRGSTSITARIAYELPRGLRAGLEIFNLLNQEASDFDDFYESRLPSEPIEPFPRHPLPDTLADWI